MAVKLLTPEDLIWGFDDKNPHFRIGKGNYGEYVEVDPTPGYVHDVFFVKQYLASVVNPPFADINVEVFISPYEHVGRTNGWASKNLYNYEDGKYRDVDRLIFLSGKRIPPLTAMTRYLVAHEFGHHVQYWFDDHFRDEEQSDHIETCLDAYTKKRGASEPRFYGPGQWHLHPKEVFANDYRTVVCQSEVDSWAHEVPQLQKGDYLYKWWMKMISQADDKSKWELP